MQATKVLFNIILDDGYIHVRQRQITDPTLRGETPYLYTVSFFCKKFQQLFETTRTLYPGYDIRYMVPVAGGESGVLVFSDLGQVLDKLPVYIAQFGLIVKEEIWGQYVPAHVLEDLNRHARLLIAEKVGVSVDEVRNVR